LFGLIDDSNAQILRIEVISNLFSLLHLFLIDYYSIVFFVVSVVSTIGKTNLDYLFVVFVGVFDILLFSQRSRSHEIC
jgi:hypothetical protein